MPPQKAAKLLDDLLARPPYDAGEFHKRIAGIERDEFRNALVERSGQPGCPLGEITLMLRETGIGDAASRIAERLSSVVNPTPRIHSASS